MRENPYIFYITVHNEPHVQPPEPRTFDPEGVLRGDLPGYHAATEHAPTRREILSSGVAMPAALRAA